MRFERPPRLRTAYCSVALALFAAVAVLAGASWARNAAQQAEPRSEADDWNGPNFAFIPIRTELQRKLVANGKSIQALVLLNGFALLGKREELMRNIDAGDLACVRLGIEFIEEDAKFPFGKTLKSNTARALRRARLSKEQKQRIRRRVFGMLRAGHIPHEYHEYPRLLRKIGFDASEVLWWRYQTPISRDSVRTLSRWAARTTNQSR